VQRIARWPKTNARETIDYRVNGVQCACSSKIYSCWPKGRSRPFNIYKRRAGPVKINYNNIVHCCSRYGLRSIGKHESILLYTYYKWKKKPKQRERGTEKKNLLCTRCVIQIRSDSAKMLQKKKPTWQMLPSKVGHDGRWTRRAARFVIYILLRRDIVYRHCGKSWLYHYRGRVQSSMNS